MFFACASTLFLCETCFFIPMGFCSVQVFNEVRLFCLRMVLGKVDFGAMPRFSFLPLTTDDIERR